MIPSCFPASSHPLALYTSMQKFFAGSQIYHTQSFKLLLTLYAQPRTLFSLLSSLLYWWGNKQQVFRSFSTYLLKEEAIPDTATPFLLPEFCICPPSPLCETGSHALLGCRERSRINSDRPGNLGGADNLWSLLWGHYGSLWVSYVSLCFCLS